jgi:flagellar hook-length control protein FliK
MSLSINSSAAKGNGANLTALSGAAPLDAGAGDFLALLTNELGNLFLAPVSDSSQTLIEAKSSADEKPSILETTTAQLPQVDPALIAALNAATAAIQNTTLSPTRTEDTPLSESAFLNPIPTIGQGISTVTSNQAPSLGTVQQKGNEPLIGHEHGNGNGNGNRNLNLQNPATVTNLVSNKTETGTPVQNTSSEQSGQKLFNLDLGRHQVPHQALAGEIIKTAIEPSPTQAASTELSSLSNYATTASAISLQQKSANQFQTDVAPHIQEKIWPQQFGEKIVWMAKADIQSAQINLNPPELGPIQITLNLSGDQAKLSFASPHLEVRQSIENALPQLKEMLSSSGINLGQANVGGNLQQQARENVFQNTNKRHGLDENAILSGSEASISTGTVTGTHRGRGLVDLFA